jgi:drug/metabolite transporter (DMT)-like permease
MAGVRRPAHPSGLATGLASGFAAEAGTPAAYLTLFLGIFCVSTSGPFLVMARMDAYVVVLLRLAFASVAFFLWSLARGELRVAAGQMRRIVVGALVLTVHFALWVKAFDLTDYASNLLLLVTQPVMAAVVGARLGDRHGREIWVAIVLAVAGLATIAGGDFALGPRAILGDLMCIAGGVAITMYYVITREARAGTPLATFMGLTFGVGAAAMVPVVALTGGRIAGHPVASWFWIALLVGVTTVAGHGLLNLAARRVRLFTLNIVIVLEPAIAIAMGRLMFAAPIHPVTLVGGALLVAAVGVGLVERREELTRVPN